MLLKELSEVCGVSGREGPVRDLVRHHLEGKVEEMRTDALGNLLVRARATGRRRSGGPTVMVAAHLDEVGLMVTGIEAHGFLRFRTVGNIDPRVLVSQVVSIGPEGVRGVVGCKPIHLQERGEEKKPFPLRDLVIDIGASSREEAERSVRLGQVAAFTTRCEELGGDVLKGKALDDRAGCALLLEVLQERYAFPLWGVFTVQEEVGLRGAGVAAYALQPAAALILEGTAAADVPGSAEHLHSTQLGKGPALTVLDRSVIASRPLNRRIQELAERHGIPLQFKRLPVGGTDAGPVARSRGGVPTAVLSVPCRYIHAPASLLSLGDWEAALRLVRLFLRSIEEEGLPV